ncbi:MAG: hypothetical protein KBC26_01525 [Candidatus Pacebacteria bacterium]|nr:hypothetical protein [Candidatus Paceibacterota bacterium]
MEKEQCACTQQCNECCSCFKKWCGSKKSHRAGASCGLYGIGFIGAAVYFIQHADTFWVGVLGVLKAAVWPAFVVYKLLEFLGM